jgi:recombination protein RecA
VDQGNPVQDSRRRKLEQTVALLRSQYGDEIMRRASELTRRTAPPHISTGFPALDALTGCQGIPLGRLTLLAGHTTSGKLTIAYKTLASLLQGAPSVTAALLDLTRTTDPDYLERCGVSPERLVLARPDSPRQAVDLLASLVHQQQIGAILVDSLPHLMLSRQDARYLNGSLASLHRLVLASHCAVIFLDEPQPPWLNWLGWSRSHALQQWTALHIELRREEWLYQEEKLIGYQATARIVKSRWASSGGAASVAIRFNGTVKTSRTW